MAASIPTIEPESIIAGDTIKWTRSLADYPASAGWVLSYKLLNAQGQIAFSASASGDDHLVNVSAATSNAWVAGGYSWRATAAMASEVYTIGSGTITVKPSFSGGTLDNRSFVRTALENIEAYLQNANNLGAARYQIAGRDLQRHPIPDLLKLRDKYKFEVAREDAATNSARGLPDKRRVMVRFGA